MNKKQTEQPQNPQEKKAKFVEPKFHFVTEQTKIGEGEESEKITVSELVLAGQLLADYPNYEKFAAKGYEKTPLKLGENVHISEDGESFLATVSGYPKLIRQPSVTGSARKHILSLEPLFIISPDFMKATLVLHPPLENGHSIRQEDLPTLFTDTGIIFGIKEEAQEKVTTFLNQKESEFKKILIAQGQQVGKSEDAYLRFEIEIGPIAGTLLHDGSIDFRDRRVMVSVKEGELIATKVEAIQGHPGINVFGEETPARKGLDVKLQILNDARYNRETREVRATKNGVVSVINNNVIKVLSHSIINSDIDYATGNVESANCLTIQGSVQPGFKVQAGGDVKITGSVMSSKVDCEGNLVVNGGITGKNSALQAGGDADIFFIEQGNLKCGGLCVIRKQSYYSNVAAGSDISCKPNSKIVGGTLISAGKITVADVGTDNAPPTTLAAGIVSQRLEHYLELRKRIVELQQDIIQWLQRHGAGLRSRKMKKMEQEIADTKLTLLRINLVTGSGMYSRADVPESIKPEQMEDYSTKDSIDLKTISIDVYGEIYAGTEIRIGNHQLKLEKTISHRSFILHPNGKRIIAAPLKRVKRK